MRNIVRDVIMLSGLVELTTICITLTESIDGSQKRRILHRLRNVVQNVVSQALKKPEMEEKQSNGKTFNLDGSTGRSEGEK